MINMHQMKKSLPQTLFAPSLVIILALLCFYLTIGLSNTASAQSLPISTLSEDADIPTALEDPTSKEAVRALVSTLSDDSVRALLIERLDAVAEKNSSDTAESTGIIELSREIVGSYLSNFKRAVLAAPTLSEIFSKAALGASNSNPDGFGKLLLILLAAVIVGVLAERLVAISFRKHKLQLIEKTSNTLRGILKILYTRLAYDILGVLAFSFASTVVISQYFDQGTVSYHLVSLVTASVVGGWMAYVVCRFFFAPKRPDLRICNTSDDRAMRITVSFSVLAAFIVLVHNAFGTLIVIGKEHYDGPRYMLPLGFWLNLSMYIVAAGVIWFNRLGLTEILFENKKRVSIAIGGEAPDNLSWFAINWPKIAILLIAFKYLVVEIIVNTAGLGLYSTGAVYITFIIIFLWPGVDANISLFVAKGIAQNESESERAGVARRTMQQGLLRVGRILIVGVVLYSLASLWGLNLLDLAHSSIGAQAAGAILEFLLILLLAYIAWELVSALIGHWLAVEGGQTEGQDDEAGGEIGGVGLSRTATLLPIVRKTAKFLIITVSFITILDKWGVNIGPLLAGAGVVGLAIGFGAQTLVKDIVSGLFFLADDAFRVGEYIDVGGTMGTVEKISLRSLRLRHHKGLVHTIPYGEIPKLTNFSRDWVIVKLRFRVPFDTDIQKVKKIFKAIGADLIKDPILGEDFLQPFKSQGVAEVDDNGMVVRGKFMAKPGKQFMIRKEVYVRVQKAFEEAGIPFARKQVMVHIPGLEKNQTLDTNQIRAIGAAAAEAAEDPVIEPPK